MKFFDQSPYEIKVEWGERGVRAAAERGDIIVIVDVLSFSSAVTAAVEHGAEVYPFRPPADEVARNDAERLGDLIRDSASGRELREKGI